MNNTENQVLIDQREFGRPDSGIEFPPFRISNSEVIYYTPIVDLSNNELLINPISGIDVSTDNLIYEDLKKLLKTKVESGAKDYFLIPRGEEFRRQFEFMHEFKQIKYPKGGIKFHIDDVIIKFHDYKYNLAEIRGDDYGWNIPPNLKSIIKAISSKYEVEKNIFFEQRKAFKDLPNEYEKNQINKINQELYLLKFTYNLLRFYLYNLNEGTDHLRVQILKRNDEDVFENMGFIDSVKYFFKNQTIVNKESLLLLIENIDSIKGTLQFEDHYSSVDSIRIGNVELIEIYINNLNCLAEFKSKNVGGFKNESVSFLTFDWGKNISSGERAFLNLYSRLYYSSKLIKKRELDEDNLAKKWPQLLIIILDEAELGFHPQWQKEYLKSLIDTIPWIFTHNVKGGKKGFTNIQIILTSHSPILLSDMPNSNVILLDKVSTNKTKIMNEQKGQIKQSFGANIHQLFYNNYFLQNGFIGDFAQSKITDIIRKLNIEDVKTNEKNEIWQTIQLVGEPFIKSELVDLFFKKFPNDYRKQQEIIMLEQRLEKLKNDSN